jgi:hypothetical protein
VAPLNPQTGLIDAQTAAIDALTLSNHELQDGYEGVNELAGMPAAFLS